MLESRRAVIYWMFQTIAEPENGYAAENAKQALSNILKNKPYHNWNEKSPDYYIPKVLKEHDRLSYYIEKETGIDAQQMSLYKFLATLENLEQKSEREK